MDGTGINLPCYFFLFLRFKFHTRSGQWFLLITTKLGKLAAIPNNKLNMGYNGSSIVNLNWTKELGIVGVWNSFKKKKDSMGGQIKGALLSPIRGGTSRLMQLEIVTWSMLGDRVCSSRYIDDSIRDFGLRGARAYGSWAPYRSGLATFSRQIFCT